MAKTINGVTFNDLSRIGKGSIASNLAFPGINSESALQDYINADEEYRNIQSIFIDWNDAQWSSIPQSAPTSIKTTSDLLKAIKYASTVVTESAVSDLGFTKNTGTVTSVKVGTKSYSPSNGVITIPASDGSSTLAWGSNVTLATVGGVTINAELPSNPVTESAVSDLGFTKNTGTVTSVKVGTTSYSPSNGVITIPAYPNVVNLSSGNLITVENNKINHKSVGTAGSKGSKENKVLLATITTDAYGHISSYETITLEELKTWLGINSVTLTSIEWESTTASSIEGLEPNWPDIICHLSDSSVTEVHVGDIGVGVPSTNITKTTAYGTYSGITVTYNGLTTSNSLKYTVIEKSVKSIAWKTTTGSSNAGTPVDISTVKNKITVTYDNNTTAEVDETEINVYKNTTHTTAAGDEWYNTAGKYYILGKYRGHTTENHITWTVNSVTNNYFLGATAKDSFEISDLNEYVASKPSSITVPNTVEPDKWTAWIYPKSWGRPTSAISSLSNAEEVQSFNYDELGVPPGYIGMWVDSTSECTYALTW